ncbi:MAG: PGPGW domain-containing protein [Rhodospirillaceae bacterium]|nr:PGPGW domain-containing protein [Rhodospirillaceae bacterium]MCA8931565.1 PGPGW domain-containing protein [Rhodospirillaceae bacterium]
MRRGLFRLVRLIAGWVLVVAGAILAPTPIPIGWLLLIVGFSILVHESETVRGWFRRLRIRYPRFGHWLHRNKHHAPGFGRRLIELTDPGRHTGRPAAVAVRQPAATRAADADRGPPLNGPGG